ncbi:MAG: ACT domain-containing protein [Deltaproteobacteria bacterium]|nr:ACT domain-containing protein [Deltaproteobacteria bacterium]
MIIMKFGGTSVGSAAQIHKVSQIVVSALSRQPLVVVSALSGATNHLLELIHLTTQKKKVSLTELIQRHKSILQELKLSDSLLNEEIEEVTALFKGISLLQECSPKTKDRILAFGERCSCKIVAHYLNSILSKPTLAIFSYDLGLQTTSQFGQAVPLKESDPVIEASVLHHKDKLIVTTGFIAKDLEGNITTLGRGGSDYSASLMGGALKAEEIQIWTDVNATMLPAINKNIPVRILNTNEPSHPGTIVYQEKQKTPETVKAIAHRSGLSIINITSTRMLDQHGFLSKIFEIFAKYRVSIDTVSTSEVSVSVTVQEGQELSLVLAELKTFSEVSIEPEHAVISVVGEGLREDQAIAAKVFTILREAHVPIRMISLGASKINLSFLVEEHFMRTAVSALHQEFFEI